MCIKIKLRPGVRVSKRGPVCEANTEVVGGFALRCVCIQGECSDSTCLH